MLSCSDRNSHSRNSKRPVDPAKHQGCNLKICSYNYGRRVKRREGKPLRPARAIRATIFTPLTPRQARYLQESTGRPDNSEGGQRHQQDRPTTGAFLWSTNQPRPRSIALHDRCSLLARLRDWLPLAHIEAPAPVSTLPPGILLKMGPCGLIHSASVLADAIAILQPPGTGFAPLDGANPFLVNISSRLGQNAVQTPQIRQTFFGTFSALPTTFFLCNISAYD